MMIYVDGCMVADFWRIFLVVIIPAPVAMADAVYPRVAGFTVFLPFIMRFTPYTEPVPRCCQRLQFVNHRA